MPTIALIIVYLVWGTTLGAIRIGVETMPWAVLPCARFLIAGGLLLLICLLRGERLPDRRDFIKSGVLGTLLFFGGNSIVAWSVQQMTTGLGGLLVATTPFWMLGFSAWLPPREPVPATALAGIGIGFIGMIILLFPQLSHLDETSPLFWMGLLLMLANALSWSLGSILARKHPVRSASILMSLAWQNIVAGLLLVPVCLLTVPDFSSVQPSNASLWALAYLIVFGTLIAMPCYLYVLKTLPVFIASTFAYVTPVLTVLFGWLFLGEAITSTTVIGSVVILSGVLLTQRVGLQKAEVSS